MLPVAVVILNHNGAHHLERFLPSVLSHSTCASVIVADNGSSDGSVTWLKENYPAVRIISFPENYGFCGGYNRALAQIEEPVSVLLNSDVEVQPNWIEPIVELFESSATLAVVQPKIKSLEQPDSFEYAGAAGGYIDAFGYPFCRGRIFSDIEKDSGQYDRDQEVFWASGACFFVRTELFNRFGGFDDDFFAHMEEIDLCWRLKNNGYTVLASGQAAVYHLGGGTLAQTDPRKTYLNYRNGFMLLVKNLAPAEMIWKLPARALLDMISVVKYTLSGEVRQGLMVLKAHGYIWKRFRRIAGKRSGPHLSMHLLSGTLNRLLLLDYYLLGKKRFDRLNLEAAQ